MTRWILAAMLTLRTFGSHAQVPVAPPYLPPPPPVPNAVVIGQVIDGTSGQPVAGVLVALSTSPAGLAGLGPGDAVPLDRVMSIDFGNILAGVHQVLTDNQGRFALTGLPTGTFSLSAAKPGWSGGGYGQTRPDGTPAPLLITSENRPAAITLRLWKNAAITGAVTDEAGEPIVSVQVRALRRTWLSGHARYGFAGSAQTDDRGVYRISALRPGDYVVAITQTPATMPASATPPRLDPAVIQSMVAAAGPGTNPNTLAANISSLAMDAGRSEGIRVGDWVLPLAGPGSRLVPTAVESGGRRFAYRTTYYPAASTSSRAAPITLGSGEERTGVDLQLRPSPAFQLSGVVTGPEGPAASLALRLLPAGVDDLASDAGFESATTTTDANGAFVFLAVPSGQYTLKAVRIPRPAGPAGSVQNGANMSMMQNALGNRAGFAGPLSMDMLVPLPQPVPSDPTLWSSVPVSLADADIGGLTIVLRSGYRISGRAIFDGSSAKPTPDQLRRMPVLLDRAETGGAAMSPLAGLGQAQNGQFDASGQFTSFGLVPGKYFVRVPLTFGNWTLKSALVNGRDAADVPLDVENADVDGVVLTFTDRPSDLSGVVRDAQGRLDTAASVVLFPVDRESWTDFGSSPRRLRVVRSGARGDYGVAGLPAGDYFVAAVPGQVAGDWQNPNVLETLSQGAVRVLMNDGERKTVDLTSGR